MSGPVTANERAASLDIAGRTVALCRFGSGDPVVYLHGLCDLHSVATASEATPFLEHLADAFEVVAPALPGYGGSTGLMDVEDVEDVVWQLVDLLDALGLGEVDVVAHSLGGWFAAELALRHPSRVRRMALVAPLGLHVAGVEIPPFFGMVAPRGIGGMGEARRILFGDPEGGPATRALPDAMSDDAQLRWFGGLAGAARLGWPAPHFQSRKLARRLGRIRAPVLVVRGEHDQLVPAKTALAWVDGLESARLVERAGAGHCVALERPDCAVEVANFVAEPTASRPGEPSARGEGSP